MITRMFPSLHFEAAESETAWDIHLSSSLSEDLYYTVLALKNTELHFKNLFLQIDQS